MAAICHTPIGGRTVRLTRLSTVGEPVTGACGQVVSSGWTSVGMSDDVDQPGGFQIRVGGALTCLAVREKPLLNWIQVDVEFCYADPDLLSLMSGATVVDDGAGDPVGWAADTGTYGTSDFALELWTGIAGTAACTSGLPRFGYLLLPWLAGGVHGDVTHDRGTASFKVQAATQIGNQWGVGPYNVVRNAGGFATPLLTAIPATRHRHWQLTTVPPPTAVCGCQAL